MTMAHKCDVCGALHEAQRGTVRLEFHITVDVNADGGAVQQGYDADLCPRCSAAVLKLIRHRYGAKEKPSKGVAR